MSFVRVCSAFAIASIALVGQARAQGRGRGRGDEAHPAPPPVSAQEQQRRITEEHGRQQDYRNRLDSQIRAAQARQNQMQAQHHAAELAQQQQYLEALQRQRQQIAAERDYAHDPYITTPPSFRYRFNGVARQTNQYGADVLRQGVNYGYQEGYNQGVADRRDGLRSNYTNSFAYQDANYGYNGAYVPQSDYNYYFRQGFRRGYSDGYGSQTRYGTFSNGSASILGSVLSAILGFTSIH
ncbi:MAG: hypothetical protein ACHQWU_14990 [Gemmatimonadales bacterium]